MRQSKGTEGFWPCCTAGWWTTRRSSSAHMLEGILDNSLGRKWITKREWGKSHWQSPYCPYWLICQLVRICGWTITSCQNFMGNLPCVRIFLRRRWLSLQPVSSLDGEGQSRTRWPQETWPFKLWQDWSQTFERTKAREQWSSQKIGTGRWLDRISALPTLYSQGQYHACALLTFVFRARMVLMKRSMPHGIISRPTIPRRRKRSRGKDLDRNFAGCRWIVATTDCRLRDWILAFANPVSCTSVVTVVTVAIFFDSFASSLGGLEDLWGNHQQVLVGGLASQPQTETRIWRRRPGQDDTEKIKEIRLVAAFYILSQSFTCLLMFLAVSQRSQRSQRSVPCKNFPIPNPTSNRAVLPLQAAQSLQSWLSWLGPKNPKPL